MLDLNVLNDSLKAAGVTLEVDVSNALEQPFEDVGVDSLDMFNLLLELETATGITIPDDELDKITNFKQLMDFYK
ncbi:phosphopantetheine-binding protein [Pseudoalteromonas sp. SSMSWG5]|uniref:phosphopantetheine-binding protein n=1 Tax=Pseudoalteromonas sp. SSMSWG5 TaxID=3139396 RepID=UPI003BA87A04